MSVLDEYILDEYYPKQWWLGLGKWLSRLRAGYEAGELSSDSALTQKSRRGSMHLQPQC